MSHRITITVTGPTGSGKTAICQLIAEALEERGLAVTLPEALTTGGGEWRDRVVLARVLNELTVDLHLQEVNLRRSPTQGA